PSSWRSTAWTPNCSAPSPRVCDRAPGHPTPTQQPWHNTWSLTVTDSTRADVLIVGSGIMGSVVARLLRETDPALKITMVDGGNAIGTAPGLHLHDVDDPVLWSRYNEQVATGIQGVYTGA